MEYDITTFSGSDSISVTMHVQSTCNNLILFSPVQDNAMGLKKLSITDSGVPLKFIQKTSSVKALNRVFNFTSYKVQHAKKQELLVNYQCNVRWGYRKIRFHQTILRSPTAQQQKIL